MNTRCRRPRLRGFAAKLEQLARTKSVTAAKETQWHTVPESCAAHEGGRGHHVEARINCPRHTRVAGSALMMERLCLGPSSMGTY